MTLMETMQTMDGGLTEREKDIRRYLLDHPEKVELFSARELGAATFTSAASVTRFCQKIGCKGYPDFKLRFLAELRQASSQAHAIEGEVLMTPRENAVSLLRKITEVQHRSVEQTRAELDLNQLIRVYQRLLDAQHLDFYAYDSSACIAEYACNQFYFAGKRAQIYRDTNMQGLNASIPATGHVAILLSHTGRNARLVALAKLLHLDASQQPEVKQGLLNRVIATMSAVFAPFVYILAAAGLVQGCLIIATTFAPAFADTGTYAVLSFISWTPFTFLPVLIAITASKHFNCNTFIAVWCCLALVNPDWTSMAARIAGGESIQFIIFNMAETTYTSTVLPPLFLVLVLSYLERFLNKVVPDIIKALAVPFICAVIMVPATILVIGPISDGLANAIAAGYNWLYNTVPALAGLIVGGFWQVIVIFGVHWGVTPMILANFENYGFDTFQAFQTCAVIAQAAACFGVFLKSRSKDTKNVALSAGLTGIFGITEPAIYGVTLRLKKPFVAGCIGGAAGALVVALTGAKYYIYAGLPGLLTTVNTINASDPGSFTGEMIAVAVTIVVTIIMVQIIGCDEPGEKKSNT